MRKFLLAASIAAIVASGLPSAQAATGSCSTKSGKYVCNISFSALVPGSALTPYWSTDALDDGTLGFGTCGTGNGREPSPHVNDDVSSIDDFVLKIPATDFNWNLATFYINPELDYDSFICSTSGEVLAQGANPVSEPCDGVLGQNDPTGMGCKETSSIPVVEGRTYIFRVYNWADTPGILPCPGTVTLSRVA